jgi:phage shock protein C
MNCKYHPDREAQAGCVGCGELVCKECDVVVGGRHFCRKCLAEAADSRPPGAAPARPFPAGAGVNPAPPKKLYRSRHDRWIAGVCGGIAENTGMDPTLVRVLAAVIIFVSGIILGIVGYVVMACVIPEEP